MRGAHQIGAAISVPRITGGNFMDTTLFLKMSSEIENKAPLCGELSMPGVKISSEIETFQAWIDSFKRMDWTFHVYNRDWFFQLLAP